MITFALFIEPVAKARPKFSRLGGGVRTYTPPETVRFENEFRAKARPYTPAKPLEGPLHVSADFVFIRPKSSKRPFHTVKPDLDNLWKSVGDAGNGLLWKDDSQIISHSLVKKYGPIAMIKLTIRELKQGETRGTEDAEVA